MAGVGGPRMARKASPKGEIQVRSAWLGGAGLLTMGSLPGRKNKEMPKMGVNLVVSRNPEEVQAVGSWRAERGMQGKRWTRKGAQPLMSMQLGSLLQSHSRLLQISNRKGPLYSHLPFYF